ncbi:MAG TPA: 8-oxo-dGTP diphosphatase [Anaerolineae bacterium]|nr:8-oxo-dGTP diphosphatase [Anaerolineae bacterium]
MPQAEQGVEISLKRQRYLALPRTLAFITRGRDEVLLLRGAPTKRLWANKYNGIGGHVERDEDILTSAAREVQEETGLSTQNLQLRGIVNVDAGAEVGILVFVFSAEYVSGELLASEEGTPEWVRRAQLNALPLVEDLPVIIPRILDAGPDTPLFYAHTHYDADDRLVIDFAQE